MNNGWNQSNQNKFFISIIAWWRSILIVRFDWNRSHGAESSSYNHQMNTFTLDLSVYVPINSMNRLLINHWKKEKKTDESYIRTQYDINGQDFDTQVNE